MQYTRFRVPPAVTSFFKWIENQPGRTGLWMAAAGFALAFIAALGLAQIARAEPPLVAVRLSQPAVQSPEDGQAIFSQKCAVCHTIGKGKLIGPDLKDVTKQRDAQWIKTFISDPAKMIASDQTARQLYQQYNLTMPTLGLSAAQIDAVVDYLSNPGAAPAPAAPVTAAGTGDPAAGKRLFTGEQLMANGGTPCIACHSVTGVGTLDGGALGPDLTHVIQRLGEPGVAAALQNIVFPTMIGPFQNHPLTPTEQANLVAFLRSADRQQAAISLFAPGSWTAYALLVLAIGLAGAAGLFLLLAILWSRLKLHNGAHLPVRKL